MRMIILAAAAALVAGPAAAEVVERTESGFVSRSVAQVSAPPDRVYAALGQIERWWDPAHSYSGKAQNLSLELKPGGCWCERLEGGGGVVHGTVVAAMPGRTLRLAGGLGPLQELPLTAVLTFAITPKDGGSEVVQTYRIGAAQPATVQQFSTIVDQVVGAGLKRFERYVETGKPD